MRKPIQSLIRIQLKMQYANVFRKPSVIIGLVFGVIGLLFIGMMFGGYMLQIIAVMYSLLEPSGNTDAILGSIFLMNFFLIFILSIMLIMNTFYFTEDITSFLHLPVHSYQLLIAKSLNPLLYVYLLTAAMYLPVSIFYGILSDAGFMYFVCVLLLFFLIPTIPYALAAAVVMFAMQFVNKGKNKDRSKVIGGIIGFALLILLNVVLRLQQDPEQIAKVIANNAEEGGLLQIATMYYPPASLMSHTLTTAGSWLSLLYFVLVLLLAIAAGLLFFAAAQKFYLKGALGINTGSGKVFSGKGLARKPKSIIRAYCSKEIQTIFRTPTFFLQCVAGAFVMPALLVVIFFMGDFASATTMMEGLSGSMLFVVILFANVFSIGLNPISIISFSKDGHSWEAHLFLPLTMRQIVFAKLQAAFLINLLPLTVLFVIAVPVIQMNVWEALIWVVIALLVNAAVTVVGMVCDLLYPKLGWTEETELFQNRLATLMSIVISAGAFVFLFAMLLILEMSMPVSFIVTVLYISTVIFLLFYIVSRLLKTADRTTLSR
ncbi:putative ABC transporter permease subunit [Terribacillus saccharophilus]|uniref:putative ABC transporter permease subunit n=1 Tax=Terribacillus saccharophilus TaxID=361277 RepID=UPI003982CF4F